MYVLLLDHGRRLVTSDANRLRLHDISDPARPELLAEVFQPGVLPFFDKNPAGERISHAAGIVARSFTPRGTTKHWTKAPTTVGIYAAADLTKLAMLELGIRLDHESLALAPDGRSFATTVRGGGPVGFDVETGALAWRAMGLGTSGTSWAPDGRYVAVGETDPGEGILSIIDTQPDAGGHARRYPLPAPKSRTGLYDSPFCSRFTSDGTRVIFTSSSWGLGGVSVYDFATRTEVWSVNVEVTDEEGAEVWSAPEIDLALAETLVLVGQDGRIEAFRLADRKKLSRLEFARGDSRYFAADSEARRVWMTRGGEPVFEVFPSDWV